MLLASADLLVGTQARSLPLNFNAGAPYAVPSTTSGKAPPSSRTVSKVSMALIDFRRFNCACPLVRQQLLDSARALSCRPRDRRLHDRPTLAPKLTRSSSSCANDSGIPPSIPAMAPSRASFEG